MPKAKVKAETTASKSKPKLLNKKAAKASPKKAAKSNKKTAPEKSDLLPIPEAQKTDKLKCRCGQPTKMYSGALEESFCSDACYEQARKNANATATARIRVTSNGEAAYYEQADISFAVDPKDLCKVVGANGEVSPIDVLLDSQLVTLAQANGLPVAPFVRELLRPVLIGIVQLVWYRDIEKHTSEHLETNQQNRVSWYLNALRNYKEKPQETADNGAAAKPGRAKAAGASSPKAKVGLTATVELKKMAKEDELPKQAFNILEILKEKKAAISVADLQNAMVGRITTKQPMSTIWAFYKKRLVDEGFIAITA